MIKAVEIDDLEVGNKILTYNSETCLFTSFEVGKINLETNEVTEVGGLDIYPNELEQFVIFDY